MGVARKGSNPDRPEQQSCHDADRSREIEFVAVGLKDVYDQVITHWIFAHPELWTGARLELNVNLKFRDDGANLEEFFSLTAGATPCIHSRLSFDFV